MKLRLSRLSPREKSAARKIVLQDGAGSGDLQKGIMNEALWAALRREGLSPELTDRDELSSCSGRPERGSRFYQAAALLCAGLLVSSDPALMFAWRGLSLYDDLNIPRLPARHLPNGNEPAVVIRVPAAWRVLLAEAESRVLPPEGRAIAERWAPEPYALAWLVKELPLSADLRAAEALAPRLHGFTLTDSGRFRELRASLELPDGKAETPVISFDKIWPVQEESLRTYLAEHREECLSLGVENTLTRGIFDEAERLCQGFFVTNFDILGGIDEGPAVHALCLRAAAAMSKYPRLLFSLRGINLLPYAEYHRTHVPESPAPRRRRSSRRGGMWGDDGSSWRDYGRWDDGSWDDESDDDYGFHDLGAPDGTGSRAPDEPGSAPWVRGWLSRTGVSADSEGEAGARAILREGRAGEAAFDPERHLVSMGITGEFGDINTVTLAFPQYGSRERGLISAMLHLYPECLEELRKGAVGSDLQKLFSDYGIPLLPDGEEQAADS